jgi:hypothetical protein
VKFLKRNKLSSLVAVYACYIKAKHLLIKARLNNIVGCAIAIKAIYWNCKKDTESVLF